MIDLRVGDLITFSDPDSDTRIAAVMISDRQCVMLDRDVGAAFAASPYTYKMNRGWFLYSPTRNGDDYGYDPEPLTDPTDEQLAAAMHIMLTGYVPGVDE